MKKYGADRIWPFAQGGEITILVFTFIMVDAWTVRWVWPSLLSDFLVVIGMGLWLTVLYFFRDPNREVVNNPGLVVSPGDGVVVEIANEYEDAYLKADAIRISIFLSVTDVHVQRVPLGGEVVEVRHNPGKFLQAFKAEASDVNENIAMVVKTGYGMYLVKQIAGILARRCVNYMEVGDQIETGGRFGIIRFSSRVDLFLPNEADVRIAVGEKVYGGLTAIAQLVKVDGK